MRKYLFIGTGGFLGAILRYLIKNIHIYHDNKIIPINTLIINVAGSFAIGLLLTVAFEIWEMDDDIRLGVTTGFLGAFTTFSTLCKDVVELLKNGDYYSAISYISMSTVIGLIAVYLGVVAAREVIAKKDKDEPDLDVIE